MRLVDAVVTLWPRANRFPWFARASRLPLVITCITLLLCALPTACGGGSSSPQVTSPTQNYPAPSPGLTGNFFGINTNTATDPWPGTMLPLTSWRTLGSQVKWADINTGPGVYDFTLLDQWLAKAKASQTDVLFTVFATPSWVSSHGVNSGVPNTCCAYQSQNGPGICDPPVDLECDGSGTDQTFISFLTALVQHVGPGTIKYWELWNEPNVPDQWNGDADCASVPHAGDLMLARMAKDLRTTVLSLDPNAKFTTPAATTGNLAGAWLADYLTNSDGGTYADINAFHGYINTGLCPSDCPMAEAVASQIDYIETVLPSAYQSKPLFDTEGYWGGTKSHGVGPSCSTGDAKGNLIDTADKQLPDSEDTPMFRLQSFQENNAITDPDQQASFVARYYLMQMWKGVAKFYWWNWDIDTSAFYDPSTNGLTPAGVAYTQIVRWTNGGQATVGPCATSPSSSTQWTCAIKSPSGTQAVAVWDTAQTCNNGTCTTVSASLSSFDSASSNFSSYLDLSGNTTAISNGAVPVGLKPILLIP
jgi:hypothetical protein